MNQQASSASRSFGGILCGFFSPTSRTLYFYWQLAPARHATKAKTKELFKAILTATTPIAIWTRYDIPDFDHVSAIDEILTFKPLCHLCESVRQTREQADAQTKEHLGFHLAILWEDPYRLTPNVMLELTTPGQ